MTDDELWMDRALAEARKGVGLTSPNPAVGAMVINDGQCVGKGYHHKAGTPHAEVHALREAGEQARGATVYVTLEPCSTHGKTPPCCTALINAGVKRVVMGCVDPNPAHAGDGVTILEAAGIEVTCGVREKECKHIIRGFAYVQERKRAMLTLKLASTLDGRIADYEGQSRWISGEIARERVHALRREMDAVMVGRRTAEQDNPRLNPRPAEGRRPRRIVLDRLGKLPLELQVFTDELRKRTLCVLGEGVPDERRLVLDQMGVRWLSCPEREHHLDLEALLPLLAQEGINHVLCEGGGELASSLLEANLVDELIWVLAPKVLGAEGRPVLGGRWALGAAPGFEISSQEQLGEDLWLELKRG